MAILLVAKNRDLKPFREALLKVDKNLDIEIWPAVTNPNRVQFAVAWNQPAHLLSTFPNLKVISTPGPFIDSLLRDSTIPDQITFATVFVPSMTTQMNSYIDSCVLSILSKLRHNSSHSQTELKQKFKRNDLNIGIIGMGRMKTEVANYLSNQNFSVFGLSDSKSAASTIKTFSPDRSDEFFRRTNILINLSPLIDQTEGNLDLDLFKKLRKPAFLIHIGSARHLIDEDLLYALDTDRLDTAYLDLFSEEPLPDTHPFWNRTNIHITPQISIEIDYDQIAPVIAENYKRSLSGIDLLHTIDRELL